MRGPKTVNLGLLLPRSMRAARRPDRRPPLVLDKMNLYARMTFAVTLREVRKEIFHNLGGATNPQHAGMTRLERTSPFAK